jgi:hypothetical protein
LFRRPKLTLSCSAEGKEGINKACDFKTHHSVFLSVWFYSPLFGLGRFFSFLIFLHSLQDSLDGVSACRKAATYTQTKHTHHSVFLSIWFYSPLFGLGHFFRFLIFLHSLQDSLDGVSARRKAATYTQTKHTSFSL